MCRMHTYEQREHPLLSSQTDVLHVIETGISPSRHGSEAAEDRSLPDSTSFATTGVEKNTRFSNGHISILAGAH